MTCNGCGKLSHIKKFCKTKKERESEATNPESSIKGLFCFLETIPRTPSLPAADNTLALTSTIQDNDSPDWTSTSTMLVTKMLAPTSTDLIEKEKRVNASWTIIAAAILPIATNTKVIIDCGATDHFFCNRDFFLTYTKYYHEFRTGSGQVLPAYGYGDVVLRMT